MNTETKTTTRTARRGHMILQKKNKKKRIYQISAVCFVVIAIGVVVLPWLLYFYTLSFLDVLPEPATNALTVEEQDKIWNENETNLDINNFNSITPYWFYRFLSMAIINDVFRIKVSEKDLTGNMSRIAGRIALDYSRAGHFHRGEARGMAIWHVTNMSLTIWIQRNWTSQEAIWTFKATSAK